MKTCVRGVSRNQADKQNFTAEFGARHYVKLDGHMRDFFGRLHKGLLDIAGDHITFPSRTTKDGWDEVTLPRHTIYNDPRKLAMPVVQMRFSRSFAKDNNIRWSRTDLGRLKQVLGDEVAGLGIGEESEIIPTLIPISFENIYEADIVDKHTGTRKLVLTADLESDGANLMFREQEVIVSGIRRAFQLKNNRRNPCGKNFPYPANDFVPKLTVGEISPEVPQDKLQRCLRYARNLMPIEATLMPVQFIPELK